MSVHKPKNSVKVWDFLVRFFHWSLVVSFIVAYFTGDEENQWHIYSGYFIAGLIVFRFVWGFIGSKYARFSNFIYSPAKVFEYLGSLRSSNPKHYLGHNPAAGYMVAALLIMLTITTITGLKVYGVEGHGPLAGGANITLISEAIADDRDEDHEREYENDEENEHGENEAEEYWEELHELASNLTVLLIILHILGVVVSSRLHKENLVKAMFTGRKQLNERE